MNKALKIILIVLASLVGIILIVAGIGWYWLSSSFISIDDRSEYEDVPIEEITQAGYTFRDLNRNGKLDVYEDDRKQTDERVEDLLAQMTLEEKVRILKGSGMEQMLRRTDDDELITGVAGTIPSVDRLGLPTIYLSDGPAGLRLSPPSNPEETQYCTAFPIGTMLASTWDTDLVRQVGEGMGNEMLEYGVDVILGPGANIHRNPLCGRNFEYYSEDPVLTGYIGAAMVNGIESHGVGACVKHYVANNQETARNWNNVLVSDRAMREIYLKGFELIVKQSQPWTIMSSYNKVNGTYVPESRDLMTEILRDEWGYKGIVMTDWFGGNDAVAMIRAGNDLLEPGTRAQYEEILEAAENGVLSQKDVDTSVRRILKLILESRKMEQYAYSGKPDLEAHAQITRESAAEGMVLLKNDGVLPLKEQRNVALFGVSSFNLIIGGTGSGDVVEPYSVSLNEGLENAGFENTTGFEINKATLESFEAHVAANPEAFEKKEGLQAMLNPSIPPELMPDSETLAEAAGTADVAIITIGRNSGEGSDRVEKNDFLLSEMEQKMIEDICEAFHEQQKKVVVVLNIGGVIETASWKALPDAILLAWQGGQESGNSITDVLTGKVNPSGKLPMTFPNALTDHASTANFPLDGDPFDMMALMGEDRNKPESEQVKDKDYTKYEEGIYVGYRHFDKEKIEVSYPFGYGLSYTTYSYDNLSVGMLNDSIEVSVTITNGRRSRKRSCAGLFFKNGDPN